jgi:hypothetical protein
MEESDTFVLRADLHCKGRQEVFLDITQNVTRPHGITLQKKINFKVTVFRNINIRLPVGRSLMKVML